MKSPDQEAERTGRATAPAEGLGFLTAAVIVLIVGLATRWIYLYPWVIVAIVVYAACLKDDLTVSKTTLAPSKSAALAMTLALAITGFAIWHLPVDTGWQVFIQGGVTFAGATAILAIDRYWPGGGVSIE